MRGPYRSRKRARLLEGEKSKGLQKKRNKTSLKECGVLMVAVELSTVGSSKGQ